MIKIVKGNRGKHGNIYLPKAYIGKVVMIIPLSKKEEKEYKKKERELQKSVDKARLNYQKHLIKLKKLREERK